MSGIRRLAFRLTPLPDEPLDSWLEAMAAAYRVPLRDVLHAVGLRGQHAPPEDRGSTGIRRQWLFELRDDQVARISEATGLPAETIRATTRTHYAACVTTRTKAGQVTGMSAAGGIAGRFCPECLADSGGRWRLTWRYVFGFACPRHRRILVDQCPTCGTEPRVQPRSGKHIPEPTRCDTCNADLTQTASPLAAGDEVLAAQRALLRLITTGEGRFGMYDGVTQPALRAIDDVRLLRRAVFAHLQRGTPIDTAGLSDDLLDAVSAQTWSNIELAQMRTRSALTSAVGYTIAVHATRRRDTARALLTDAIPEHTVYSRYSPVMQDILAETYFRTRRRTSRLQQGTVTTEDQWVQRVAKLPAMLWQDWADVLLGDRRRHVDRRAALSSLTMLVGTSRPQAYVAGLFGAPRHQDPRWLSTVLGTAVVNPTGPLIALARNLDKAPTPIDYARRRAIDWGPILTPAQWHELAEEHNVHSGGQRRHRLVQLIVYVMLTGNHPLSAPEQYRPVRATEIAEALRIHDGLPERLRDALARVAETLLRQHGIDEPVTWSPPLAWADFPEPARGWGVPLPPRRPVRATITTDSALAAGYLARTPLRDIATTHNVSRQSVARELTRAGIPLRPAQAPRRHDLDARWLQAQYVREQRSLRDLAGETGASATTIKRRLVEVGVQLRPRGGVHRRA